MKEHQYLVVAGVLIQDGKLLVAQRKADASVYANVWELPGGKVEFGENPAHTVERELQEELNIEVKTTDLIGCKSFMIQVKGNEAHIILLYYRAEYVSGQLECLDAQDVAWMEAREALKLELVPADREVIEELLGQGLVK